jgi:hypothetical protein
MEDELARRSSDADRGNFLARVATFLGTRCKRPDLAIGMVERALLHDPKEETLTELLRQFRSMADAAGFGDRRRAGRSPGGMMGRLFRWISDGSRKIEEDR